VCVRSSAAETKPFTITATQGLPKKQRFTLHRGERWANCRWQKLWYTDKQHWGCSYNLPLSPTRKISQLWWALTNVKSFSRRHILAADTLHHANRKGCVLMAIRSKVNGQTGFISFTGYAFPSN